MPGDVYCVWVVGVGWISARGADVDEDIVGSWRVAGMGINTSSAGPVWFDKRPEYNATINGGVAGTIVRPHGGSGTRGLGAHWWAVTRGRTAAECCSMRFHMLWEVGYTWFFLNVELTLARESNKPLLLWQSPCASVSGSVSCCATVRSC